jgi:HlyD family secretion protein
LSLPPRRAPWLVVPIALVVLVGVAACARYVSNHRTDSNGDHSEESVSPEDVASVQESINVKYVHPQKGVMEHMTVQPGSIQAYESVHLFAKVSGYLKQQNVDIGDRVKRGQILAIVDVPEVEKQVQRNSAAVEQANAKVEQMIAQVASAKADADAARAAVVQAEANAKSTAANLRFREKQLQRMKDLFASKSIDERLVDESQERHEAAFETEQAAKAAIHTTKAQALAAEAKIRKAEADVLAARAEVRVAQADFEKSKVLEEYAIIHAPFDGVISNRTLFPGDFVRSAGEGSGVVPLLTVQRTDRMRVVVQIPDREVPYADPGDPAIVEIDALPEKKLKAKISRIAQVEDPQTRLMHIEIDLPNPTGKIRQGMYGRVSIMLDKSPDTLSIPSACLLGKAEGGKGTVYLVQDKRLKSAKIRIGTDNGVRVEIMGGLMLDDRVVLQPRSYLSDGLEVEAAPAREGKTAPKTES